MSNGGWLTSDDLLADCERVDRLANEIAADPALKDVDPGLRSRLVLLINTAVALIGRQTMVIETLVAFMPDDETETLH